MRHQHALVILRPPRQQRGHKRDPETPALVPEKIRQTRRLVILALRQIRIRQLAHWHKQRRNPQSLQRPRPGFVPVIRRQREARVVPHRQRKHKIPERQQLLHSQLRQNPHHHRRQHPNHKRPRPQHQPGIRRRVPIQPLQHLRNQHGGSVQREPEQKVKNIRQRKVPIAQQSNFYNRVRMPPLPHNRKQQRRHRHRKEHHDKITLEPVQSLPAIQHHLQARKRDRHRHDSPHVNLQPPILPRRFHFARKLRRILQQPAGQNQRNNPNRNIDEENPPPAPVVRDPSAQRRPNRRRRHNRHAVQRERRCPLRRRERVHQNRLLHGRQSSAAYSLQNAEKDQHPQARRKSAKQRTDRKQRHANHVVTLPSENPAQPRRKRQDHRVRNQLARQHPRALVRAHRQPTRDVRQRHVGNRRVQQLHERGQRNRNRDEPRVDRRPLPGRVERHRRCHRFAHASSKRLDAKETDWSHLDRAII